MKSCIKCIHHNVCKIYHGEMASKEYRGRDFRKHLEKLQIQLGESCKEYLEKESEPPSKSNKNSLKLCLSGSGDLDSAIFGCQPLLAGIGCFRSLVMFSDNRRDSLLEVN